MSISHTELKRLLHYDPETGVWTWLVRCKGRRVGQCAGSVHKTLGYRYIGLPGKTPWPDRRRMLSHRLAWFYMTGNWPKYQIDHKDRNRSNDRWDNLREATQSQNNANFGVRKDNPAGLKGVSWDKRRSKWYARIKIEGRIKYLGESTCPAAAHFAYLVEADKQYGEFARAR